MQQTKSKRSHVLLTLGILFTIGGAARFLPSALAKAEGPNTAVEKPAAPINTEDSGDDHDSEEKAEHGDDTHDTAASPATKAMPVAADASVCLTGETARQISKDRALVDTELAALRAKEIELKDWQAKLKAETNDLQALQQALDAKWEEMQAGSTADIKHLAQMYGSMKPDQAAQIFNKMDPGFAAGFLRKLSSSQAGLILAAMETEKAYIVSVKLASMNNDVRIAAER